MRAKIDLWTKSLRPLLESRDIVSIKLAYLLISKHEKEQFSRWINICSESNSYSELDLPSKNRESVSSAMVGVWSADIARRYYSTSSREAYDELKKYYENYIME